MKKFLAVILTAFLVLTVGQASAASSYFSDQSIESLKSSLVCDTDGEKKDKKKKKDGLPEEKEPECD